MKQDKTEQGRNRSAVLGNNMEAKVVSTSPEHLWLDLGFDPRDNTPYRLVKVPIIEPLTPHNLYEHTPLDVYKYGEYPRFIRPVGAHGMPRYEICKERIKGEA